MRTTQYRHKNSFVLYNESVFNSFSDSLFDQAQSTSPASSDESAKESSGHSDSQGRGTVLFFEHEQRELVLKRYHRGGLIGRFVKSSYVYCGLNRTRMWREFQLLATMKELGLPVPRPVAVRCVRSSLMCYQGEMIAERISNSRTLAEILCSENLPEKIWESIGLVVRRFHQHAIEHADLNACNILLNANGQVFLIDFDKSVMHDQRDQNWCQANLSRLRRSLNKWKKRKQGFHFEHRHWQALERGYQGARNLPVRASAAVDATR
jgi:3-deoxy-D-manno-octulosonic acid kinase